MEFKPENRKKYWIVLTAAVLIFSFVSFFSGDQFVKNLSFTWLMLLLMMPLVSEFKIGGISFKKEIEKIKDEIKTTLSEIKISLHQSNSNVINIGTPEKASPEEYNSRLKKDIESDEISTPQTSKTKLPDKTYELHQASSGSLKSSNLSVQQKLEKAIRIEKQVGEYISNGIAEKEEYLPQRKFVRRETGDELIVDGVIRDIQGVREIIEIKYYSSFIPDRKYDNIYFQVIKFISKINKLGLKIPIRYVFVSEEMTQEFAKKIDQNFNRIRVLRKLTPDLPRVKPIYLLLKNNEFVIVEVQDDDLYE